jgi:hypothetical protein
MFSELVTLINWGKPLAHQSGEIWSNPSLIVKVESRWKLLFWNTWFGNSKVRWRKFEGWSLVGSTDWWLLMMSCVFTTHNSIATCLLHIPSCHSDSQKEIHLKTYTQRSCGQHIFAKAQWTTQEDYDFAIDRPFHNPLSQWRLDTSISKHIHDWTHAILVARALSVIICQVDFLMAAVSSVVRQGERATKTMERRIIWWKFNGCIIEDGVHACKFAEERKQERIGRNRQLTEQQQSRKNDSAPNETEQQRTGFLPDLHDYLYGLRPLGGRTHIGKQRK